MMQALRWIIFKRFTSTVKPCRTAYTLTKYSISMFVGLCRKCCVSKLSVNSSIIEYHRLGMVIMLHYDRDMETKNVQDEQ